MEAKLASSAMSDGEPLRLIVDSSRTRVCVSCHGWRRSDILERFADRPRAVYLCAYQSYDAADFVGNCVQSTCPACPG